MSKWERVGRHTPAPPNLPPPEVCVLTTYKSAKDNKVILNAKAHFMDTPLDEFGRPDIENMLVTLGSTIDKSYKWPTPTNVHHLAYDRAEYYNIGKIGHDYRESSSLMVNIPVQAHNLLHRVFAAQPIPDLGFMNEYVLEQKHVTTLFELGRQAIKYEKFATFAHEHIHSRRYYKMAETVRLYESLTLLKTDAFYRFIDHCPDGEVGILPDLNTLATLSMSESVTMLGEIGGAPYLDRRRMAQEAIYQHGL